MSGGGPAGSVKEVETVEEARVWVGFYFWGAARSVFVARGLVEGRGQVLIIVILIPSENDGQELHSTVLYLRQRIDAVKSVRGTKSWPIASLQLSIGGPRDGKGSA